MTHSENNYVNEVFLSELRNCSDLEGQRKWSEHQEMQLQFLYKQGFQPDSKILDVGCGPMRLGVALIPELNNGWYYGQDINSETLEFGEEVLRSKGISSDANYTLFASDKFCLEEVKQPIDIAFSNSLFSHLNLNSIMTCLINIKEVLVPGGYYYSTFFDVLPGQQWVEPIERNKWGHSFYTNPNKDPYHYSSSLLQSIAKQLGFKMKLINEFGHPTQTMASLKNTRKYWF